MVKEVFSGLVKILSKISVKIILVTASLISIFLLSAPESILAFFGVESLRNSHKATIGLTFLISSTVVILIALISAWNWAWDSFRSWQAFSGKDARRRLDAIGDWNRSLIRQLYEAPTHSQKLPLQNANVQALLSENVIAHSPLGDVLGFDCVLQPWVVQYLDKHKNYLASITKFDKPYRIESPFL